MGTRISSYFVNPFTAKYRIFGETMEALTSIRFLSFGRGTFGNAAVMWHCLYPVVQRYFRTPQPRYGSTLVALPVSGVTQRHVRSNKLAQLTFANPKLLECANIIAVSFTDLLAISCVHLCGYLTIHNLFPFFHPVKNTVFSTLLLRVSLIASNIIDSR